MTRLNCVPIILIELRFPILSFVLLLLMGSTALAQSGAGGWKKGPSTYELPNGNKIVSGEISIGGNTSIRISGPIIKPGEKHDVPDPGWLAFCLLHSPALALMGIKGCSGYKVRSVMQGGM